MRIPIEKKWKVQLLNHPFFSIRILHYFPYFWLKILFGNKENIQKMKKLTIPIDKRWMVQLLNRLFFACWNYIYFFHNLAYKAFCMRKVISCERLSLFKGCLPHKVVFHGWLSSFIKGCLPSKVVFHQRLASIKLVFHQNFSSLKVHLSSKIHQRLPSIKGRLFFILNKIGLVKIELYWWH